MRIMVIPEDPVNDQYVLRPLISLIAEEAGIVNPRVAVLENPRMQSVTQALDPQTLASIASRYKARYDVFVLAVDADCDPNRQAAVDDRAEELAAAGVALVGRVAIQEVEVWALAPFAGELRKTFKWQWEAIRAECDPKEVYFAPFIRAKGWGAMLGRGRHEAMKHLTRRSLKQVLTRCAELAQLRDDLASHV